MEFVALLLAIGTPGVIPRLSFPVSSKIWAVLFRKQKTSFLFTRGADLRCRPLASNGSGRYTWCPTAVIIAGIFNKFVLHSFGTKTFFFFTRGADLRYRPLASNGSGRYAWRQTAVIIAGIFNKFVLHSFGNKNIFLFYPRC